MYKSDLKILSNILALGLNKVIASLVNSDQTGFIPGRSTNINIQRLFTNLQVPNLSQTPRALVAFGYSQGV